MAGEGAPRREQSQEAGRALDRCSKCGARLSRRRALEGLCPRCLLDGALDAGDDPVTGHQSATRPANASDRVVVGRRWLLQIVPPFDEPIATDTYRKSGGVRLILLGAVLALNVTAILAL